VGTVADTSGAGEEPEIVAGMEEVTMIKGTRDGMED